MGLYKRFFAWFYHTMLSDNGAHNPDDPMTRDIKIPLLTQATGKVLEVGAGDGSNLTLYGPDTELTLLDLNPHMLRYLKENAINLGIDSFETVESPAEKIPFPDDHFDTVVTTHVLCSVRDQAQTLSEIRRVLKPGGRFFFLEHVAAHPETTTYWMQNLINPAWKIIGDGCHVNRDTGAAIRAAGFAEVEITPYQADFPGIVSPHIYGWAQA